MDSLFTRLRKNAPEYGLKQGDYVYLDAKHRDHLEVFQGQRQVDVINLDGTANPDKANKAMNRTLP